MRPIRLRSIPVPRLALQTSVAMSVLLHFLGLGAALAGPSRLEATQLVLDSLVIGTPEESTAVVYLYHRDLPDSLLLAGTILADADGSMEQFIESPSFFFLIDREPRYLWGHAANFVTVDATTGEMTNRVVDSWPLLNGLREERFLPMGNASPDLVFGQYPDSTEWLEFTPVATGTTGSWAVIVVGNPQVAGDDTLFANEARRAQKMLNTMPTGPHVDAAHITTIGIRPDGKAEGATRAEVCTVLENLAANCDKLHFTYIGHGSNGSGAFTRDTNATPWKLIAEKLIKTRAKVVCVRLVACYSGKAIAAFEDAEVRIDGSKRKFNGSVVTSSNRDKKTTVTNRRAPFHEALEACLQDPLSDLNGDGQRRDDEAAAWAERMSTSVAEDEPRWKVFGSGARTELKPPVVTDKYGSKADGDGELKYDRVKFEFLVISAAGDTVKKCRQRLYIRNETVKDHKWKYPVTVWCVDNSKKPAKRDSIAVIMPEIKAGQRACVAVLPDSCKSIEIKKTGTGKPALPLSPLSGPIEILSNLSNTLETGAVYAPGEFVFFDLPVAGIPGESYTTTIDPVPGWDMEIDPASFTVPLILPDQVVVAQGTVPDTATAGAWLHARIVRVTPPDTVIYRIHALLHDSLSVPISGGDTYRHHYLDCPSGLNVSGGIARVEDSIIRLINPVPCTVSPGGDLRLIRSTIQPVVPGPTVFAAQGHLEAEDVVWAGLEGGLRLQGASGFIREGLVVASGSDGLTVSGDQSAMFVDFLSVDGSVGHGVVIDNASACLLQNLGITASGGQDVLVRNNSMAELRDASYDRSRETLQFGSSLTRSWTTAFLVTTYHGEPIAGADVQVTDAMGQVVLHQPSNAEGFTNLVPLVEYIRTSSTATARTPHTVRVTLPGDERFFTYVADGTRIMTLVATDSTSSGTGGNKPPERYLLAQNAPNPVRTETVIRFDLPEAANVHLRLFDVRGVPVAVLSKGQLPAGSHRISWRPEGLASGMYFCLLEAGMFREVRKLMVE